jgi:hypothetical protein
MIRRVVTVARPVKRECCEMNFDTSDPGIAPPVGETDAVPKPRRLSQIFRDLAQTARGPITIGQVRDAMGDRSFAALLVLFAAFNLLPLPPGATLIFGVPLILVSAQMVLGYQTAWLPRALLDKSIDAGRFRDASAKLVPRLEWLERLIKPRHWPFARDHADRIIGSVALVLAIAVFLPIPLGNWLPAFATAIIGLALSERDGLFLAVGILVGVVSLLIIGVVVGAAGMLASAAFDIRF